jgi:hypothetical protein
VSLGLKERTRSAARRSPRVGSRQSGHPRVAREETKPINIAVVAERCRRSPTGLLVMLPGLPAQFCSQPSVGSLRFSCETFTMLERRLRFQGTKAIRGSPVTAITDWTSSFNLVAGHSCRYPRVHINLRRLIPLRIKAAHIQYECNLTQGFRTFEFPIKLCYDEAWHEHNRQVRSPINLSDRCREPVKRGRQLIPHPTNIKAIRQNDIVIEYPKAHIAVKTKWRG